MATEIKIPETDLKESLYESILPQIYSLVKDEVNFIANISNITSALQYSLKNVIWTGFYFLDKEKNELVLGPFQGRVACTRLQPGKGVCGTAFAKKETVIVEDVESFPGHIYCDASSRSEIVIPVIKNGNAVAVLDIDSDILANFDSIDARYLEELIRNTSYLFDE